MEQVHESNAFEVGERVWDKRRQEWGTVIHIDTVGITVRFADSMRIWAVVYSKPEHLDYLTKWR